MTEPMPDADTLELLYRLNARFTLNPETDCWEWSKSLNGKGYGQIRYGGRQPGVHRVAYQLFVGPIPEGLQLDHLCRVRHCVNPAHLEAVTAGENQRRGLNSALIHMRSDRGRRPRQLTVMERAYAAWVPGGPSAEELAAEIRAAPAPNARSA